MLFETYQVLPVIVSLKANRITAAADYHLVGSVTATHSISQNVMVGKGDVNILKGNRIPESLYFQVPGI